MVIRTHLPLDSRVFEAGTGREALQMALNTKPDLIFVDLSLPDMNGIDLIDLLRKNSIDAKIIVLTGLDNPAILGQAVHSAVDALILKTQSTDQLESLLTKISKPNAAKFIDPAISVLLEQNTLQTLSKREYEVIELISRGLTNQQIADHFTCSVATVRTHRARIMQKTGTRGTAELIALYLQGNVNRDLSAFID